MAQKMEQGPMQIQHGHNGEQVYVGFGRMTDHVFLTPAQAEAFVAAVQNSLAKLREHQAKGKASG